MAANVDRSFDQGGLSAGAGSITQHAGRRAPVGRIGDTLITSDELYDVLLDEAFLPAEQVPQQVQGAGILGYLADQPVVVELEPAEFVDLIIRFYDRSIQEMCQC